MIAGRRLVRGGRCRDCRRLIVLPPHAGESEAEHRRRVCRAHYCAGCGRARRLERSRERSEALKDRSVPADWDERETEAKRFQLRLMLGRA